MKLSKYKINKIKKLAEKVYKKAVAYSRRYNFEDMCGACGIASGWMLDELDKINIKAEAVVAEGFMQCHVYVLVNNEYILDITYKQFNPSHRKYAFIQKDKADLYHIGNTWFWNLKGNKVKTKEDLIVYQKQKGWSYEQVAF